MQRIIIVAFAFLLLFGMNRNSIRADSWHFESFIRANLSGSRANGVAESSLLGQEVTEYGNQGEYVPQLTFGRRRMNGATRRGDSDDAARRPSESRPPSPCASQKLHPRRYLGCASQKLHPRQFLARRVVDRHDFGTWAGKLGTEKIRAQLDQYQGATEPAQTRSVVH